jgi:hypothetical protein
MCADFRFYTGIINFKKWWWRRDKPYSVRAQPRVGTDITLCLDEHRVPLSLQLRSRLFPLSGPHGPFSFGDRPRGPLDVGDFVGGLDCAPAGRGLFQPQVQGLSSEHFLSATASHCLRALWAVLVVPQPSHAFTTWKWGRDGRVFIGLGHFPWRSPMESNRTAAKGTEKGRKVPIKRGGKEKDKWRHWR